MKVKTINSLSVASDVDFERIRRAVVLPRDANLDWECVLFLFSGKKILRALFNKSSDWNWSDIILKIGHEMHCRYDSSVPELIAMVIANIASYDFMIKKNILDITNLSSYFELAAPLAANASKIMRFYPTTLRKDFSKLCANIFPNSHDTFEKLAKYHYSDDTEVNKAIYTLIERYKQYVLKRVTMLFLASDFSEAFAVACAYTSHRATIETGGKHDLTDVTTLCHFTPGISDTAKNNILKAHGELSKILLDDTTSALENSKKSVEIVQFIKQTLHLN